MVLDWGYYLNYWSNFSGLVPVAALPLINIVDGLQLLRLVASRAFTTAALLQATASFIDDWFSFFLDGGNDV